MFTVRSVKRVYTRFVMQKQLPPTSEAEVKVQPVLSVKGVRKYGNSVVVTLSAEVRKALDVQVGDKVAFRKVGRYVLLAVVRAYAVVPISEEEIKRGHAALGG